MRKRPQNPSFRNSPVHDDITNACVTAPMVSGLTKPTQKQVVYSVAEPFGRQTLDNCLKSRCAFAKNPVVVCSRHTTRLVYTQDI